MMMGDTEGWDEVIGEGYIEGWDRSYRGVRHIFDCIKMKSMTCWRGTMVMRKDVLRRDRAVGYPLT